MRIFVFILAASFPFFFAAFLFWPEINSQSVIIDPPVTDDDLFQTPEIIKNYKLKPSEAVNQPTSNTTKDTASIYKWTDESGKVVFSDKADHPEATLHTPKEIGYINVSDDIKQMGHADPPSLAQRQVTTTKKTSVTHTGVRPYRFSNTNAGQKHKYVLISGRISEGQACKRLQVVASAKSDEGQSVRGVDEVSYNGFGSTLFEMKVSSSWNGGARRPQWEIKSISGSCLAP